MSRKRYVPFLVAIVGGSGSGKTWLAEKLENAFFPNAVRLALDDFYRDRSHLPPGRRARINFDRPGAIDWVEVETAVRNLAAGCSARVPEYDFKTHCRLKTCKIIPPKPIVLLDGLWLLHRRSLRSRFRLRIFIECPMRVRLQRRLKRDSGSRGRTADSVRRQFKETVQPMHRRHVALQSLYADVVIRGTCSSKHIRRLVRRIRAGICPN